MKYLIKFVSKRDIRLLIRYNHDLSISHSSLYSIDEAYYILLNTVSEIKFPAYIDVVVINDKTRSEEYLYKWAESEILQLITYIAFEENSVLSGNCRMFSDELEVICRLFEPLADIVAILNYTDDSFSDGGIYNNVDSALNQVSRQCAIGASIIDLGAESSRPQNVSVIKTASNEIKLLKQILPCILDLKRELGFVLSVDTYHPETVAWLLDFEIDIINDVSGSLPLDLVKQILDSNRRYIAMHSLTIPVNPAIVLGNDINPVDYLYKWQESKIKEILDFGCSTHNLILDPGIGFGVTLAQSWFIIRHLAKLHEFPCELFLGHSRKSFFSHITNKAPGNRDLETAVVANYVLPHVDYIRLHELDLLQQITPVFNQLG